MGHHNCPEDIGEPELLRDPAAWGRGQVQGLQSSRRGHRDRPVRSQVLREGRPCRLRVARQV